MAKQSDIADKLDEARALIEKGWCQGWSAKDASGARCSNADPSAVSLCTMAAVENAVGTGSPLYSEGGYFLLQATGAQSIISWNDAKGRTQAEVIEAFRKAAELARAAA